MADDNHATIVERTGLAVVHRGEKIFAALGSEAQLELADAPSGGEVHFYFPVEVHVIGGIPEEEKQALEDRIWQSLHSAMG